MITLNCLLKRHFSDLVLILIELVDGWVVAVFSVLRPNEDAELAASYSLKVLLAFHFTVGITSRLIKLNTNPITWGKLGYNSDKLYLTSAGANYYLTAGTNCYLVSFGLLKIIRNFVSTLLHEVGICYLHLGLELTEGIISLGILFFTDLVLFDLANIL